MYKAFYFIILISLPSCLRYPADVERALKFAGDNRTELEQVLEHYRANPADSLKYRAACFLIKNMPDCYSFVNSEYKGFRKRVTSFASANDRPVTADYMRMLYASDFAEKYGELWKPNSAKIYDAHIITAFYLLENIDFSFKLWQEAPWGKHIPFDVFCEEILPYRVGNEPLENWKKPYHDSFHTALDSLLHGKDDLIEAGRLAYQLIYNRRWIFDQDVTGSHLGAEALLECRLGNCNLQAYYATYVFRALGIPAGIDCIVQNPDMPYPAHYWNYMKDGTGRTVSFELYQQEPLAGKNRIDRKKGKVYRICFGRQPESLPARYKGIDIAPPIHSMHLLDVSALYFEGVTVTIDIDRRRQKGKLAYLGVFNNNGWVPVACSEIIGGKAVFPNVEPGIVYCPLFYHKNMFYQASVPLITGLGDNSRLLEPQLDMTQEMTITRKFPWPYWYNDFKHRTVGGRFEGSNKDDFSNSVILHTITHELSLDWFHIRIDYPGKFKYLRYCSAPDGHCNMAEVQFISSGKELSGKVIGTEGSTRKDVDWTKNAVFDRDPLTFFDSPSPDGAWAGMELQSPQQITDIEYLFRNDDNSIRDGDKYELVYFLDNGVVSLGQRTGSRNGALKFDSVPTGALYLLHNHTRGIEERPFTYENGKQVWW